MEIPRLADGWNTNQNFWDLQEEEILDRIQRFGTAQLNPLTMKFQFATQVNLDSPYLFTDPKSMTGACALWFELMWQKFGIIPMHCHSCWKVVIKPQNVAELFKVYNLLKALQVHGKAGVDPRQYSPGFYSAFVYNRGMGSAREMWGVIRKAVSEHIRPDLDVILKRGCTEFEMGCPSNQWVVGPEQVRLEKKILQFIDTASLSMIPPQPEWLERKLQRRWVKEAHAHGDMSYAEIDLPFGAPAIEMPAPPITYHKEEWNDGEETGGCTECGGKGVRHGQDGNEEICEVHEGQVREAV